MAPRSAHARLASAVAAVLLAAGAGLVPAQPTPPAGAAPAAATTCEVRIKIDGVLAWVTKPVSFCDDLTTATPTPGVATQTPTATPTGTSLAATATATATPPTATATATSTATRTPTSVLTPTPTATPGGAGLHVSGNQLLNAAGQPVRLRGVNYSGTEYACIQGFGVFDGPSDAASVQAIASWRANAVRVPLNEDCWLGINGAPAAYSGANYRTAITNYVALLTQNGLVSVLELHWSAPGTAKATGQRAMPDRDHSPAFWSSVATTFKANGSVVFDLFNEPYPDNNADTAAAWACWKNGGTCPGMSFQAAGMQELVTAVRATGATNVIMLSGIQYANTTTQWLSYKPSDPLNNLVASIHVYPIGNICGSVACYNAQYAPVAASVPLIAGEFGESVDDSACGVTQSNILLDWLDQHNAGYLAWVWQTWGTACGDLSLITNFNGTAHAPNGTNYKARLAAP